MKIATNRQLEHIIQSSLVHQQDKQANKRLLDTEYLPQHAPKELEQWKPTIDTTPVFPAGLYWSYDGEKCNLSTGELLVSHLQKEIKQNGYYRRMERKPNGKHTFRRVARKEIDKTVYTFSPWLNNVWKKDVIVSTQCLPHLQDIATLCANTYKKATGHTVLGVAMHLEEVLHYEVFSMPIAKGELTDPTTGRVIRDNVLLSNTEQGHGGSKKFQNAGFGAIGVLRYEKVAPVYPTSVVNAIKADITKKQELNGCQCPDLELATTVDDYLYSFVNASSKLRASCDKSQNMWVSWKREVLNRSPEVKLQTAENNVKRLENVIERQNKVMEAIKKVAGITIHDPKALEAFAKDFATGMGVEYTARFQQQVKALTLFMPVLSNGVELGTTWKQATNPAKAIDALTQARFKWKGLGCTGLDYTACYHEMALYTQLNAIKAPKTEQQVQTPQPTVKVPVMQAKQPKTAHYEAPPAQPMEL